MTRGTRACLLLSVFAATSIGCGGRTEGDFSEGTGGSSSGLGGANHGASGNSALAGTPGFAGAPSVAGAPGSGGGLSAGGAQSAGAPGFAGFPNHGGAPGFAGSPGQAGAGGGFGGVIVDACVAVAQTACNKCLCQVCSDAVISCFSDLGCASIFGCVERTGCQGLDCYTDATCRPVIQQFGGLTGTAASEVFQLASCAAASQNSCVCN